MKGSRKKKQRYFIKHFNAIDGIDIITFYHNEHEEWWKRNIDWWIEEIEVPSDEDIERAANEFFKKNGYQYTSHEIFQAGAKAVRGWGNNN